MNEKIISDYKSNLKEIQRLWQENEDFLEKKGIRTR